MNWLDQQCLLKSKRGGMVKVLWKEAKQNTLGSRILDRFRGAEGTKAEVVKQLKNNRLICPIASIQKSGTGVLIFILWHLPDATSLTSFKIFSKSLHETPIH